LLAAVVVSVGFFIYDSSSISTATLAKYGSYIASKQEIKTAITEN